MKKNLNGKVILIIVVMLACIFGIIGIPGGFTGKTVIPGLARSRPLTITRSSAASPLRADGAASLHQRPFHHRPANDDIAGVRHQNIIAFRIVADGAVWHHQQWLRCAQRNSDPRKQSRKQLQVRILEHGAHLDRAGRRGGAEVAQNQACLRAENHPRSGGQQARELSRHLTGFSPC